jgi:hypothetical protein
MADNYIDQQETLGYGEFAARQIKSVVVGLDPAFDSVAEELAARIGKATKSMEKALQKAGELPAVTFTGTAAEGKDPVKDAGDVLSKLVKYADSREGGDAIVEDILGGDKLGTIKRRRPAKLVHALDTALRALAKHKDALPEHEKWTADVSAARAELAALDSAVRASRNERKAMTPAVAKARDKWLRVYGAAKLVVQGILRLHDAEDRMSDVFDDLAEVHRVTGVTDEPPQPHTTKQESSPAQPAAAPVS